MKQQENQTIRCPFCGAPIRIVRVEDQPDDSAHYYVYQCAGCRHEFGPEWRDGDPPVAIIGGEPWVPPSSDPPPLALTVTEATRSRHLSASVLANAAVSVVLAFLSIMLILSQVERPLRSTLI